MTEKKLQETESFNQQGVELANKGRLDEAIVYFKKAITLAANPNSYYLLGLAHQVQGKTLEAKNNYLKAVKLSPDFSMAHNNLGTIYLGQKDYERAIKHFKTSISKNPKNANAHNNLGNAYKATGKFDKAISCYQKALDINPNVPETINNLGLINYEKGNFDQAIKYLNKASEFNYAPAYFHLTLAYVKQKKSSLAIESLGKYLRINPKDANAYALLGNIYQTQGNLDKSIKYLKMAFKLNPESGEIINDLGNIYKHTGDLFKAAFYYQKALKINPNLAGTFNNLGVVYLNQGKLVKATKIFEKAIRFDPKLASAYYHLGLIYERTKALSKASECLKKAYEIDPALSHALFIYAYILMQKCDWERFAKIQYKLDNIFESETKKDVFPTEQPFLNVIRKENLKMNYLVAKGKSTQIASSITKGNLPYTFSERSRNKKIRIGYLSNDFYAHATSHLILGLFRAHHRSSFEVYAYSYGPKDTSPYRKRIEKDSDYFRDIFSFSFKQAADVIYKDKIDILIDMKGHTRNSRLEIPALKPAPIQVHFLGFPGTTGANFIDYFITDKVVTPESFTPYFSEKLVYLPHSYQINDDQREISTKKLERKGFGLATSPGALVFSCFNRLYKVDKDTFASWMNILKRIPSSLLWLYKDNPFAEENIKRQAKKHGVDPKRIIFSTELEHPLHLKRLSLSDLALDTFLVNGHTTTSDALWAGVPVITHLGKHFASRVSASLLSAIGLPELITHSPKEYEDLTVRLAQNPDELLKLRLKLRLNKKTFPLFDTKRFVRNLEKAYEEMWNRYLQGKAPKEIII